MKRLCFLVLFALVSHAADLGGKWNVAVQAPNGREYKLQLDLAENGGKWSGSMSSPQGSVMLDDIQVSGSELSYSFTIPQGQFKVKLNLEAGLMKGSFAAPDGVSGAVTASRATPGVELVGDWTVTARDPDGYEQKLKLTLKQEEGILKGSLVLPGGEPVPLAGLKLEGSELTFRVGARGGDYNVKMTLAGSSLKGTYSLPNGETRPVEAVR